MVFFFSLTLFTNFVNTIVLFHSFVFIYFFFIFTFISYIIIDSNRLALKIKCKVKRQFVINVCFNYADIIIYVAIYWNKVLKFYTFTYNIEPYCCSFLFFCFLSCFCFYFNFNLILFTWNHTINSQYAFNIFLYTFRHYFFKEFFVLFC